MSLQLYQPLCISQTSADTYASARKECETLFKKNGLKMPKEAENDFYYRSSVEKNTILVQGLGVNVRGNMQYVLNELNHNDRYKDFRIFVRTKEETDPIVKGYIKQNNWSRTETVPKNYSKKLESCEYLITESYFPYHWLKKDEQKMIDLWHGTPIKCIGLYKNGKSCHVNDIQQKNFLDADYFLYPNNYTEEKMLLSYRIKSLLKAKALMLGYPRTGGMLAVTPERQEEIRKILAPNGEKIYAYMPTWKGYLSQEEVVGQSKELLDFLDDNLRDDQILYVNLHHKVSDSIDYSGFVHIKKFPPLVDSYELMSVTEALISDYSSVFFDYLPSGKQIILDLQDYQAYLQHQGLYFDIAELPFDKAYTKEELLEMLNRGKTYDDTEAIKAFSEYDSAENSQKLCRLFVDDESGLNLHPHPSNELPKVLCYSYRYTPGRPTDLLEQFMKEYDKERFEVYLSCFKDAVHQEKGTTRGYPMMYDNYVISMSHEEKWFSAAARGAKELAEKGIISNDKALQLMETDLALIPKRSYGRDTIFDSIWIYDAVDPDIMMGMSLAKARQHLLFIRSEMLKDAMANKRMASALCFAAARCNGVLLFDKKDLLTARDLLKNHFKGEIAVIDSVSDLKAALEAASRQDNDYIVQTDLNNPLTLHKLPAMYKNQLMAHSLGGYEGHTYINNEICLKEALKQGFKYLEADLMITEDGHLVCSHGWTKKNCQKSGMKYSEAFSHMTKELFLAQTVHGMPTMGAETLYDYMVQYPDIFLQLSFQTLTYTQAKKMAELILDTFHREKHILDRLLIQINSKDMFDGFDEIYHFETYQYIVLNLKTDLDDVVRLCEEKGIEAISLSKKLARPEIIRKIKDKGLALLVFTIDDASEARRMLANGADTICTNFLTPESLHAEKTIRIIYNSKGGTAERLMALLEQGVLTEEITETRNGSFEYSCRVNVSENNPFHLMGCQFEKSGYAFTGWYARYRESKQDEWKFLCNDNLWRTKPEIKGKIKPYIFADQAVLKTEHLPGNNKIIFEAVWK